MDGVLFARRTPASPAEYLRVAKRAEQYVASFLEECEDGIRFVGEKKHNHSLYDGTAGILHMYVQFYHMLQEEQYRATALGLTAYLRKHYMEMVQDAKENGEFVPGMAEAFYTGIGGVGLIFDEVYREFEDDNALQGLREIVTYYREHAVYTEQGAYWSDNAPVFFDGGIALFLTAAYKTLQEPDVLNLAVRAADYILAHGTYTDDSGLMIDHLQVSFKHNEPNFEFGTAGIGFLFTKIYEVTGEERYLEAAKKTVQYLRSIAVEQEQGYLIPYKPDTYPGLFYLGNCHGPVGTAKLFYELYQVTKDAYYFEQILELCKGIESLGAPYKQSAGYWNTTCVCCGPAGFLPLYEGVYTLSGDAHWKELQRGIGEILLGTRTEQAKFSKWRLAFDRTKPEALSEPAGFFTGTAGIAVALLRLYENETQGREALRLIDDPY